MIEPTDEIRAAFLADHEDACDGVGCGRQTCLDVRLAAVLAIVARQHQQEIGDAFQRGWWRGQHQLCPRCGVELEREVAAERGVQAPDTDPYLEGGPGCECPDDADIHLTTCPRHAWVLERQRRGGTP